MFEAANDSSVRRRVLIGFLIFVSLTYAFYAMAFFIPAYVVNQYGLSPTTGATIVVTIFEIGGVIGGLTGGLAGDVIGRRLPAMTVAIFGMLVIFLCRHGFETGPGRAHFR